MYEYEYEKFIFNVQLMFSHTVLWLSSGHGSVSLPQLGLSNLNIHSGFVFGNHNKISIL